MSKIMASLFFRSLSILIALLPSIALADSGDTPVSQGAKYITDAMLGATGITLAAIAIIAVGLLCTYHYLQWIRFLQTVIGISIIFGAVGMVMAIKALVHP